MILLLLVTATCVSLALLYYAITKNYNYWEKRNVPYEKPYFIFGSMYPMVSMKQHLIKILSRLYEKFQNEPYFGVYMFHQPNLVIRSPELVKKILVKDFDKFADRNFATNEKVDPIAYHAMFSSRGAVWKAVRSKISPVFTSGKMRLMLPLMQECADNLTAYLTEQNGKTLDYRYLIKKYAVDVISSCAFGINAYCLKDDNSEIRIMASRLFDSKSIKRNFSLMCMFFIPKLISVFRLTFMDPVAQDYLMKMLNSTIKERKKSGIVRNDLVDLLTEMQKNEKITEDYKFDEIKMAANALTFFSAGNDTTSFTVSFALYEVALQSDIQKRLKDEAKATYQKHGSFTYEALQEMKYLDMVFNETLRKWPLTTFLNREAVADYTIEETGLKIEKGTVIVIPVGALHFDPEYFPDPNTFNPERFSDENKSNIKPYTFMPFGEGPRNCIGQRFAALVSKVAMAHIMKDFTLHVTAETDVPLTISPKSLFLRNDGGINLKITKDD